MEEVKNDEIIISDKQLKEFCTPELFREIVGQVDEVVMDYFTDLHFLLSDTNTNLMIAKYLGSSASDLHKRWAEMEERTPKIQRRINELGDPIPSVVLNELLECSLKIKEAIRFGLTTNLYRMKPQDVANKHGKVEITYSVIDELTTHDNRMDTRWLDVVTMAGKVMDVWKQQKTAQTNPTASIKKKTFSNKELIAIHDKLVAAGYLIGCSSDFTDMYQGKECSIGKLKWIAKTPKSKTVAFSALVELLELMAFSEDQIRIAFEQNFNLKFERGYSSKNKKTHGTHYEVLKNIVEK